MACEVQGEGDPSPLATSPSTQRKLDGNCYGCGQKGHWIANCPTKIGKGSSTPPGSHNNVPVLRCGCHRTCFVRVSHTEKNPNRKYYYCPECEFIGFCDTFEAIMCPCGAGFCTINLDGDGEKGPKNYHKQNKRYYYTCRIRRGHGACGFTQFSSAQHPWPSQVMPISSPKDKPPLEETPTHHPVARNQQDSSDGCNLVTVEGRIHVSRLGSQSEIHGRQIAFCNQMSSAGDSPTQCKIVYILGVRVFGWLGRLVFSPSRSLADPPFYYADIYDHNRTSSIWQLSHAPSVNVVALEQVFPASPREDAHPFGIPSSHKRLRSAGQNDPLLGDLMERHMIEKCRYDDICQMHQEAVSAFTTCDKQLQSLRERSAFIRNMLGEVEKLLLPCETETEKLKNDVQELSKQLMHSKRKMEVTSRELMEAVRDDLEKARY
ncbi:hypothetical protein SLE2022_000220 [Rubroshorea leprosula]